MSIKKLLFFLLLYLTSFLFVELPNMAETIEKTAPITTATVTTASEWPSIGKTSSAPPQPAFSYAKAALAKVDNETTTFKRYKQR